MDALESIYASGPMYNNLTEPLVRVDKDWKVIPGQARASGRSRQTDCPGRSPSTRA